MHCTPKKNDTVILIQARPVQQ